jgi:hypothetical protein
MHKLESKIVFVSPNTKDYAGEPGTALKPDLAQEFATLGMEYAPNLAAAKHLLGVRGAIRSWLRPRVRPLARLMTPYH